MGDFYAPGLLLDSSTLTNTRMGAVRFPYAHIYASIIDGGDQGGADFSYAQIKESDLANFWAGGLSARNASFLRVDWTGTTFRDGLVDGADLEDLDITDYNFIRCVRKKKEEKDT
jgi:uncharacterized protein YjbI with pentapeptide repeats